MNETKKMHNKLKINLRAFKLIHSLSPTLFPIIALKNIFSILISYVNLYMSAEIINELAGNHKLRKLTVLVIMIIGANFVINLIGAFFDKAYENAYFKFNKNEELLLNEKTLNLDYADIENPDIHQLRREITNAMLINGQGTRLFIQTFGDFINNISDFIFALTLSVQLIVLLVYDGTRIIYITLFLALILLLVLSTLYNSLCAKIRSKKTMSFAQIASYGQRINSGIDCYNIGKDIRLYGASKLILKIKKEALSTTKRYHSYMNLVNFLLGIPKVLINRIIQVVIYANICLFVVNKIIKIGDVLKYVQGIDRLITAITGILSSITNLKYNTEFLRNYLKYIDIPSKMASGGTFVSIDASNYLIEFKNVSFKYPGSETYALRNINISIKSGSHLAIVGMNGSGKTTFIKLLCRLYDPCEGEILLNRINIKSYIYDEYLSIFSVIFQDFKLFSFSLGQNIALENLYNKDFVLECLNKVSFEKRYGEMPKGLDTYLYKDFEDDGVEISGGEAQKIALARLLYKNSPFIILDEPTSALDPISEYEIYSKFNEIACNKTAVFISHRLLSCRFCDDIAVFDGGELVQYGKHDLLLDKVNGKYFELWTAQAQYYTEKKVE